jgi:uncharacterized protein
LGPVIMRVGILQLKLCVYDAMSLKDKRSVIKGLKERVRHKFNVSAAEVEGQDNRRNSVLAFAMVSNDGQYIGVVLNKIVDLVRQIPQLSLLDYEMEMV